MKQKIIISFIITILLILFEGLFSINKMVELSDLTQDLYGHPLSVTNSTKTIQTNIISMHRYMKDVVLSKNKEELEKAINHVNNSEKIVYKEFANVFERYLGNKNDIQTSYQAFVDWKAIRDEVVKKVMNKRYIEAADITKAKGAIHVEMLNNQVSILVEYAQNKASYFLNNSMKIKQDAIYITFIVIIVIMFIITAILILLLNNLRKSEAEIKKQNTILLEQSRLAKMGEMISMIAHQWRQPLAAISSTSIDLQMNLELEHFDLKDEEGRQKCTKYFESELLTIDKLVNNLTTTIDDFRNFYKHNKVSSHTLVKLPIIQAIKIIERSLESDNITIVENYNATKEVEIYTNEFMQVMLNILKNAQDNFNEKNIEHSQIIISTDDTNNGVAVRIEDNGGGISEEVLPNIFDPYFSTKHEKNGTALGLYMSKIIIEDHHNGKLSVHSKNGHTTFNILINDEINKLT